MRNIKGTLVLSLTFLILTAFPVFSEDMPAFWEDRDPDTLSREIIDTMTAKELLGQIFFLGYSGEYPSESLLRWVKERNIGGIKIFGWNTQNLDRLVASITDLQIQSQKNPHEIPLMIATDQEGGWIRHVKGETSETPGNMAIGATGLPYDAYTTGYYIGLELHALGINMNFAPDVDVYINYEAHVIGPRAFSSDPLHTSVLSTAYFNGMRKAGIICTAKHFPGHGGSKGDSHGELPVNLAGLSEIWDNDLLPYRFLIREGIPAIMSGHLSFPAITGNQNPASLSPILLTDLLKKELGFRGIIVTDDLLMGGVRTDEDMTTPEICVQAIKAGNDMVMVSRNTDLQDRSYESLLKLMQEDPEFYARVEEAAHRILKIKLEYLRGEQAVDMYPDGKTYPDHIPAEDEGFFFDQACRSVTLIRKENFPLRFSPDDKILLAGQLSNFFETGLERLPQADEFEFDYSPMYWADDDDVRTMSNLESEYDIIIFCLTNLNSLEVLHELEDSNAKVYVISTLTPVYLQETPWVENALAVYGTGHDSLKAGFAALLGDFIPTGILPVNFNAVR